MTEVKQLDLIEALLRDHADVRSLFDRLNTEPRARWADLVCELRLALVRHEVAEEEVVYPAFRKVATDGDAIANARIAEQAEAKKALAELEGVGIRDDRFIALLDTFRQNVLAHAEQEEQGVFLVLRRSIDPEGLRRLGHRYERAKSIAPTHPHPHAPDTPPGNVLLGPVVGLIDRVRDAVRRTGRLS